MRAFERPCNTLTCLTPTLKSCHPLSLKALCVQHAKPSIAQLTRARKTDARVRRAAAKNNAAALSLIAHRSGANAHATYTHTRHIRWMRAVSLGRLNAPKLDTCKKGVAFDLSSPWELNSLYYSLAETAGHWTRAHAFVIMRLDKLNSIEHKIYTLVKIQTVRANERHNRRVWTFRMT